MKMKKLLKVLSLSTLAYVMGKGVKTMAKPRKKYRLTADSPIVRGWVFLIQSGQATIEDVPEMLNLIELVASLLKLEEVNEPTAEPGTEQGQEAPQPNI
ncbi:MAG: hypothetical protein D8B54_06855 [Catonella sp.]|nr:MAG: hypothetical protein D8B54_06855 [Catonella sp.]